MDLSNKSQARSFHELDPATKEMVGDMLDKLRGVAQKLERLPKTINDVTIEQNTETRTIIIDAVRQIVEQKRGQGGSVTSIGLVELSSSAIADSVLGHLKFVGMYDRHEEVVETFGKTFEWAYHDPKPDHPWSSFINWLRGEDGLYWINGKAGSGKSTLMRYLFDNPRTGDELRIWGGEHTDIAGFFFWNSGTVEQRSHTGLRSLLFEILKKRQRLVQPVLPELWDLEMSKILRPTEDGAVWVRWTLPKLKKAFENLARQDIVPLKLCLFIDGLDEFEGEFNDIIEFCQSLAAFPGIKVCVSSRPLVEFGDAFRTMPGLMLHQLTFHDVEIYTRGMLDSHERMLQLAENEPERAPQLVTEIVEAADGVFLWVKLVVKSLLAGLRNRDRISDLQIRLRLFPRDLDDFYRHMLQKVPVFYLGHASRLFQIVRASQSISNLPLTTLAVYFADENNPDVAIDAPIKHLSNAEVEMCCEDMDIRLKANCGGLLEISADSDNLHSDHDLMTRALKISKRKVLYLHRTVKDFLEQPEIWAGIQSHTTRSSFNPHVALLRSTVMRLKTEIVSHGPGNNSFSNVWDLIEAAVTFAREAEIETSHAQTALLREVKRTSIHHWKMEIVPPPGNWVTTIWKRIHPESLCLEESCHCKDDCCSHDFISFSIHYGMPRYALDEITQDPKSVGCNTGRPWLDYALSVQLTPRPSFYGSPPPASFPNLDLLSALLNYGSDPNRTFKSKEATPWQRALEWVECLNANDPDACTLGVKLLKLLLDYGAHPTRTSITAPMRKPLSALAIVDRVFIENAIGGGRLVSPEAEELRRLLVEKNKMRNKFEKILFWNRRSRDAQKLVAD